MPQVFCHTHRLLGLLFALALLGSSVGIGRPAAQAASAGCTGAHCLFAPLISAPGPVAVIAKDVAAVGRAAGLYTARVVVENISPTPLTKLALEINLIYTTGVTTATLLMYWPVLLPGQRAEVSALAPYVNNVLPQAGEVRTSSYLTSATTEYVALSSIDYSYNCANLFAQTLTATVTNTTSTALEDVTVFFDTPVRFPAGNTFTIDEPIPAGASHTLNYTTALSYGVICDEQQNPQPTTVYAYGRVVQ
jgi:hypothetical protein